MLYTIAHITTEYQLRKKMTSKTMALEINKKFMRKHPQTVI